MTTVAMTAAMPKNIITLSSPSISSPISFAKPITWIWIFGVSLLTTLASTAFASSYFARIFSSSTCDRP